ncbi:hypothetical protein LSAT2_019186 [Lamellibrachia satsuma]|nr:hypothetical protein LSAT2_019186 [Lamellibrachia satsuma]
MFLLKAMRKASQAIPLLLDVSLSLAEQPSPIAPNFSTLCGLGPLGLPHIHPRPHPLLRHSRYRARTSPEPPPPVAGDASSRRERFGRIVSFIPEIDPVQRLGATPEQSVIRIVCR